MENPAGVSPTFPPKTTAMARPDWLQCTVVWVEKIWQFEQIKGGVGDPWHCYLVRTWRIICVLCRSYYCSTSRKSVAESQLSALVNRSHIYQPNRLTSPGYFTPLPRYPQLMLFSPQNAYNSPTIYYQAHISPLYFRLYWDSVLARGISPLRGLNWSFFASFSPPLSPSFSPVFFFVFVIPPENPSFFRFP